MKIFTIGFTNKTAERFFYSLRQAGVKRVVDVRLNNTSQLSGFAKKTDLKFFLQAVVGIDYIHVPELAPTQELLDAYKKSNSPWSVYETEFLNLMERRHIETALARDFLDQSCLLCSEDGAHHCHRRLVAEYLERHWADVSTEHLE